MSPAKTVENIDELLQPFGTLRLSLLDAFRHASFYMAAEHGQADPVQSGFGGRELLEDFDAQARLLDHPSNAADLSFYAVQACDKSLLLRGVQHTP